MNKFWVEEFLDFLRLSLGEALEARYTESFAIASPAPHSYKHLRTLFDLNVLFVFQLSPINFEFTPSLTPSLTPNPVPEAEQPCAKSAPPKSPHRSHCQY